MNTKGPFKGPTRIAICPEIMALVVANCPAPLNKTAFVNMTLAEALTKNATIDTKEIFLKQQSKREQPDKAVETRVEASPSTARAICIDPDLRRESTNRPLDSESEENDWQPPRPKAPRDPFKLKRIDSSLIPPELQKEADLILEFWASKKGTRSKGVFKRVINKLLSWKPEDRTTALCSAVAGAWSDLYEPKAVTPKQGSYRGDPGPDMKHPAHRDFTAERIEAERNGNSEGVLSGIF